MNIKLTLAVTLAFVSGAISLMELQAQPQPSPNSSESDRLIFIQPPQASRRPAPGRRRGGGSFGGNNQCPLLNPPLSALVPGTEETLAGQQQRTVTASRGVRSLTAEGYPTFWFYVPYSSTSKLSAKLVLVNDKDELVAQETYSLAGIPGIVKIRLSSTSMPVPLEVGKDYRWSFSVICNPQDPSANTYVEGQIERIELSSSLITQLKTATPQEKVFLYAKEGLWHETVTTLIEELRSTDAKKATLLLTSLLQSVGLNDIAQQSVIECCIPINNAPKIQASDALRYPTGRLRLR